MRIKAIAVIVVIALVIGVAALLQNPNEIPPGIEDQPSVTESTNLQTITNVEDEPVISEAANVQIEDEGDVTVAKNGSKIFIIKVGDSPKIDG